MTSRTRAPRTRLVLPAPRGCPGRRGISGDGGPGVIVT
jgi:hypothetical protein